ncbi:hypothetical protein [uncultured Polaribacter sp.]|uniref:hypothetical protein n=1 Tax=uncultured Polaribacter sp. TaxID=174711 RepID=UPI00262C5AB3|nr:hypothetical protein [uncultured Polaribacter sp.]
MEKSIENIWIKGFMNTEKLQIPKVVNLYNKKSDLLLEKIKHTYSKDNKSVLYIAAFFGIIFSLFGYILLGLYGMSLMIAMYFLNKKMLKNLENIPIINDNYQYLKAYRIAIKKIIAATTKLLGFGFPLVVIPGYWLFFRNTEMYTSMMDKIEPLNLFLGVVAFAILISFLGILIYKLTTKLVYGNQLQRLNDLINDMEELNKD